MKRRHFLQLTGTAGILLANDTVSPTTVHAAGSAPRGHQSVRSVLDKEGKIGGRTLDDMISRYHCDLFDDFLPFMDKHIVDHRYGGFMTNADRNGNQVNRDKRTCYVGRGIWVYSHLYRTLAPENQFLEVARKSAEFILRAEPAGDTLWPNAFTCEGDPVEDRGMLIAGKRYKSGGEVYDDLFVADGFAEYARASGKTEFTERAIDILLKCERLFDDDQYAPSAPLVYMGGMEAPILPGCRNLGVWMVMIRLASQLLEVTDDERVLAVADRCIESILKRHHNKDFDLLVEVLNHDFSTPDNVYAQLAYTGHGIETLWMVMAEAIRRKDKTLFDDTARLFKRHLEVSWDDVYQGWYRGCRNVDENIWILDKALWVQEEALIGLMMVIEHTGAPWAKAWLRRAYPYVINNFCLSPHGYSLWDLFPDRRVRFVEEFDRVGNFHHPRHLMLNLNALKRMKKRNGEISSLFG